MAELGIGQIFATFRAATPATLQNRPALPYRTLAHSLLCVEAELKA